MKLVAIAALIAVCGAAKLDRTYLPPSSAASAGGNSDSLQTPLSRSSSGQGESSGDLPTGSYTNSFQGVVVDAAAAGIRSSSDGDQSALGGPRDSYGSTNSKVGDAAFRGSVAGFRNTPAFGSGLNGQTSGINVEQSFSGFETKSERPQAFKDRNSNIITYANDVSSDNYSYGFESDNGIAIGENGVANNGIQAQGGYSYKGDDGQIYKVTYVADEGGYRPQGAHLPTPPPIPKEILESLEQNAKEEAAGLVDDGSYDAQKYNAEGDYSHYNGGNIQYNGAQLSQFAKRPESDATSSSTFINQHSQAFGKPEEQLSNTGNLNTVANFNEQSNIFNGNKVKPNVNEHTGSDKESSQILSAHQQSLSGLHNIGHFAQSTNVQTPQLGQPQSAFGSQDTQFGVQHGQHTSTTQAQAQISQFVSQSYPQGSATQFGGQTFQVGSQINREQSSQFSVQPNIPSLGHDSSSTFNSQSSQVTQFSNQAPSNLQGSFNPSASVVHGLGPAQVSQTPFNIYNTNKPSFGTNNSKKPAIIGQGQSHTFATATSNGNQFPNALNQFGAEYLPPFKPTDRPSHHRPDPNAFSSINNPNKDENSQDFVALQGQNQAVSQTSSTSMLTSLGSAGSNTQPDKPLNAFESQFSRPNQFNNQYQLTSQKNNESNAFLNITPTKVPDTELTTPLEPNEKPAFFQSTQSNNQFSSSLGSSGLQTPNNQAVSLQNTVSVTQQSSDQTVLPSNTNIRPQMQFNKLPSQTIFSGTQESFNTGKPQFTQNSLSQNQQNGYYNTQKPSFSQGSDDSYYYNQPSKPFGTPASRPQPARFPSSPSYQSNGIASFQNTQFTNQQSLLQTPSLPSLAPIAPTSSSQYAQTPGIPSTNYYNGITQAAISAFPSVPPTSSSNFDSKPDTQAVLKPSSNQPASLASQFNRPTGSQKQPSIPSFPTKPSTTFGQNPSPSLNENQIQFGQSSSTINNQPSLTQSLNSKPVSAFEPTISTNQIQSGPSSSNNNDQSTASEITREQESSINQQYQGTVYEYNKPPEVLPPPEQSDSASSQNSQTDTSVSPKEDEKFIQNSKPQFGSQQTQFGQTTFTTETQQFSTNQGAQNYKPLGSPQSTHTHLGQNSQFSFGHDQQSFQKPQAPLKLNGTDLTATTQFNHNHQAGLVSGSQFGSQPAKPFGTASVQSQFGKNPQQSHEAGHLSGTTTFQTQSRQPLKPTGVSQQTTAQFEQNTFSGQGTQTLQQSSKPQLNAETDNPIGNAPQNSQVQMQGSLSSGFTTTELDSQSSHIGTQPLKPFSTFGSSQGGTQIKPFDKNDSQQDFQGYPSSKPPAGTQLTHPQFTHTSQQAFGTRNPTNPIANVPSNFQKPQFSQNAQFNQGNQQPFGQSTFQGNQFASTTTKPQFGTQFGTNQNIPSVKPFNSAISQAQFSQSSAQVSSSAETQQQPQGAQVYNPFSTSQGSSFQNKPQFDQASQSSGSIATQYQFGSQSYKPFSNSGPINKPDDTQNKPFVSQQGSCCKGSKDSAIAPLNLGKPSQAFAQTQNQFTGFQGAQGFLSQSVAGKGEEFGGPRQPPSFDAQTGYHY